MAGARRCFRARGFHATSTAEICAEAKVGVATLFRYFPTKDALILAIIEEDLRNDLDLVEVARRAPSLRAGLDAAVKAALGSLRNPDASRLRVDVLTEALRNPAAAAVVRDSESHLAEAVATMFRAAQDRGEMPRDVPVVSAATMLLAMIDGLSLRVDLGGDLETIAADCAAFFGTALGLRR
jgi:AcrR family transcriptional regulator